MTPPQTSGDGSAGRIAEVFAGAVDDRDWAGLASLLAPGSTATLVHTGERSTGAEFVAFNREYRAAGGSTSPTSSPRVTGRCCGRG